MDSDELCRERKLRHKNSDERGGFLMCWGRIEGAREDKS